MKKTGLAIVGILVAMCLIGCSKEIPGTTKINDIIEGESYVKMILGEAYLQEQVLFDLEQDYAVVPQGAAWGLPKYRENNTAGVSYGEEGGAEVYTTDREANPELYPASYLDALKELQLTVKDVRDSGYDVKIVKKKDLDRFEEELTLLSGMVVNDAYKLTGVSIRFDDEFRPIKKEYQFEKKDKTRLDNEETDSEKCTQEFDYDVGKVKFDTTLEKVKKEIDRDM